MLREFSGYIDANRAFIPTTVIAGAMPKRFQPTDHIDTGTGAGAILGRRCSSARGGNRKIIGGGAGRVVQVPIPGGTQRDAGRCWTVAEAAMLFWARLNCWALDNRGHRLVAALDARAVQRQWRLFDEARRRHGAAGLLVGGPEAAGYAASG